MNSHFLLWLMLIVPWFSLFLMDARSIKRFTPAVILCGLIVTIVQEIAYTFRWYENMDRIVPWGTITNVSLMYGFFAVGTYWIFYFSYGKLAGYLLMNIVIDGVWLMFAPRYLEKAGIFRFVNLNAWLLFLICMAISLVLYAYQAWQETIYKPEAASHDRHTLSHIVRRFFGNKEPAG